MKKYLKFFLVFIIGLLFGLIIHGLIEIPVIFLLTDGLRNLFLKFSWKSWVLIHHIFSIIIEILAVILVFVIYRKYEQDFTKKEKIRD